jgi:hypothetical protein
MEALQELVDCRKQVTFNRWITAMLYVMRERVSCMELARTWNEALAEFVAAVEVPGK